MHLNSTRELNCSKDHSKSILSQSQRFSRSRGRSKPRYTNDELEKLMFDAQPPSGIRMDERRSFIHGE